jgi:hypothetical protein
MAQVVHDATRDDDTPEGLSSMDKYAVAVLEAALGLAGDPDCDDQEAVAELQRMARHRESLRVAEINSRSGGRYRDFEVESRAQRLLEAALTGQPVRQLAEPDSQRIQIVEDFAALPEGEQWGRLVMAIPQLDALDAEASLGAFVLPSEILDRSVSASERVRAARDNQERVDHLCERLDVLLGPRSSLTEPLLGSTYARRFAADYLLSPARVTAG